ncbi:hypothetical protein DRP04_09455 [Archaeoglobales archaeon]|nr:MAG: hypothetical protein DRP04_09455 [Archaeoglobales archaeon]
MKVDIIVLNYNGLNFLKTCVQSIYQYTLQRYRLIVVDNGSTETGTAEYLKQIERKPNTIVVRKEENTGFPGGINAGLEVAESEIVVLANNDLLFIDKHWLDKMLRFLRHDVVAVSCKLIYPNNKIQFAGSTLDPHAFSSYNLFRHRGRFERRELYSVESEEMPFVTFALVVADRKARIS